MTGDKSLFASIKPHGGVVRLGDNSKVKITGIGKICNSSLPMDEILLVEGLTYNLLSISQL